MSTRGIDFARSVAIKDSLHLIATRELYAGKFVRITIAKFRSRYSTGTLSKRFEYFAVVENLFERPIDGTISGTIWGDPPRTPIVQELNLSSHRLHASFQKIAPGAISATRFEARVPVKIINYHYNTERSSTEWIYAIDERYYHLTYDDALFYACDGIANHEQAKGFPDGQWEIHHASVHNGGWIALLLIGMFGLWLIHNFGTDNDDAIPVAIEPMHASSILKTSESEAKSLVFNPPCNDYATGSHRQIDCYRTSIGYRVSLNGSFGPIHVGMSVTEAYEALSLPALSSSDTAQIDEMDCTMVWPMDNQLGFGFMTAKGTIVRVDVTSNASIKNAGGFGLGSKGHDIALAYGQNISVRPAKYVENGQDYIVSDPDYEYAYVFEIAADGLVSRYRVGRRPEVEYVEQCL